MHSNEWNIDNGYPERDGEEGGEAVRAKSYFQFKKEKNTELVKCTGNFVLLIALNLGKTTLSEKQV